MVNIKWNTVEKVSPSSIFPNLCSNTLSVQKYTFFQEHREHIFIQGQVHLSS